MTSARLGETVPHAPSHQSGSRRSRSVSRAPSSVSVRPPARPPTAPSSAPPSAPEVRERVLLSTCTSWVCPSDLVSKTLFLNDIDFCALSKTCQMSLLKYLSRS